MVILDSTILIDFLKGRKNAIEKIKELEEKQTLLHTTQINVFELIQGIYANSQRKEDELMALDVVLQKIKILDINYIAAYTAGKLTGELSKKGITIQTGDALIAGTGLAHSIHIIVTKNVKDFSKISGIQVETY